VERQHEEAGLEVSGYLAMHCSNTVASIFRIWRLLFVLFILPVECPLSSAVEPFSNIRDTVAALSSIRHPGSEEDLPYDVPEAARPLLSRLKHQLRDLILTVLNDPRNQGDTPGQLTEEVQRELGREDVAVGANELPKSQEYGGILSIEIAQPKGNPDLLAATTTLQVPCSQGDTSLYVFKREAPGWKPVVAVESNNYPQVNGAQDYFDYAVSPRDQQGQWYVVTAHIPGWCTSCWSGIHYQVLRPGSTPDAPRILLKKEDGVYRCGEPPYKLVLEPTGFKIDYVAMQWLDFDLFTTIQADRYVISSDHVTRVAPVAYSPQDFLNAWAQMPWNEAQRWSNPARASSLESWHRRFQPTEAGGYLESSKFEFVQACDKPPTRWQIGLNAREYDANSPRLFFIVSMKEHAFYLESIDVVLPPGCPGETAPSKTLDWERFKQLQAH
jgi:hypothetical protein